ncbi:serine/threonine-protein kinase [Iningainema tapete]|uniref:non-specific serine/threonine protein kinase n=1 Tax=Iningainema tapete BLCC-T55 TaxID=2748662 RepID=A0A8J7CBM3_9CYAN|nr:protein kinase [Iningainema tapete BLCC-T55]
MICCLNPDCPNPQNPDGTNFCLSCGTGLVPILRNRYRIIAPLGGGGFGRTYLAEDLDKLNEQCVVKQLSPQVKGSWSLKKATELFEQEAKRLQQLGEHPQIPTLYGYFKQDNYLYLVQQYIKGQNLLQELQHQGAFNEAKIRELLSGLLPVLQTVHNLHVIHRDIKPDNIIRRSPPHPQLGSRDFVLIDFGVAKAATTTALAKPGTSIGSFGYAPIEQMQVGEAYPASDLYSLGATCFHLLTNIAPRDLWIKQGYGWISQWRQHVKQPISQELEQIIDKLLKENYRERYPSAKAAFQALNNHSIPPDTIIAPFPILPPQPPTTVPESSPRVVLTSSGSSLLLLVLLSFFGTAIASGIWLLILAGFIFASARPIFAKTYLLIISVITTLIVVFIFKSLPMQASFRGLLVIVLSTILAGLLAFTLITLSQIFNKFFARYF